MKKIILSLLALLLIAGCTAAPKPAATPEPTVEPTVEPTPTANTETGNYEKGTWTDTAFESKTLNIRFTLPEGWAIQSDEYQQAILDAGSEVMGTEGETQEDLYLEFLLTSANGKANVQAMSSYVGPMAKSFSLTLLSETMKAQLTAVEEFNYEVVEEGTVNLGGEEYGFIYLHETNYDLHQKVYFRVVGEYLFNITVSADEANIADADAFISSIAAY